MISHSRRRPPLVVALDLGGSKLAASLVTRAGKLRDFHSAPTALSSREACLRQLASAARDAVEAARGQARAIGVSIPGLVRRDGTVWAPNLPGWEQVPLARHLARATGLPVVVESDRNASVAGEAWRGAARGATDAVYLIVGTGIGAGILSGGRLVRGADELSGCAGWLVLDAPARANAGDQRLQNLESLAAGPAISAAGTRALGHDTTARDVMAAARRGHPRASRVVEQTARYLGLAVANIISLLNPQVVVLGGGVGESGPVLLVPLRRVALQWTQPLAARRVKIVASRLGGRAPLLGAARLAWQLLEVSDKPQ